MIEQNKIVHSNEDIETLLSVSNLELPHQNNVNIINEQSMISHSVNSEKPKDVEEKMNENVVEEKLSGMYLTIIFVHSFFV